MSKKIVIYGENWVGTLPRLLNDNLTARGFEVTHFDFMDILPGIKNRSLLQRIQRKVFEKYYINTIQSKFCEFVYHAKPDIVLIIKGFHLDHETLHRIKKVSGLLVNWNPDDFFNMKNSSASLLSSLPLYDVIVSSRKHLFPKYQEYGAQDVFFLDWYYVPELHFYHDLPITILASFVGSWSPAREEFINQLNTPFKIWGGGWEKSSRSFRARHAVQNKILNQTQMSAIFSSSRFNLNLLTHENNDFTNLRLFEVPASGGLLLTERNPCASQYLIDGEECLMFSSVDEVNSTLNQGCQQNFDRIARAGFKRIRVQENSFSGRVDTLLLFLECRP